MSDDDTDYLNLLVDQKLSQKIAEQGLDIGIELRINGHSLDAVDHEVARYVIADAVADHTRQRAHIERLALLGEMSAEIVHDINNLATSIHGFARIAQRSLDNPARLRKVLDTLVSETARCTEMAMGFLSMTRTGPQRLMAINESVEAVAALMRHQLRSYGVSLATQLDGQNPIILGNDNDISRLLFNLLYNAQQAIGRDGNVLITTHLRADAVELRVRDDGPGVPAELRAQIFEPMFTTKAPGQGTGLGLAICARIAAAHQATIRLVNGSRALESQDDRSLGGAEFVIRFPAPPRATDE